MSKKSYPSYDIPSNSEVENTIQKMGKPTSDSQEIRFTYFYQFKFDQQHFRIERYFLNFVNI